MASLDAALVLSCRALLLARLGFEAGAGDDQGAEQGCLD